MTAPGSATLTTPDGLQAPAGGEGFAAAETAVEVRGLRKTYGSVVALDRLTLQIPKAAVGLLGANGAGKTTLLKILLGLSKPTEGSATVLGYAVAPEGIVTADRNNSPIARSIPISCAAFSVSGSSSAAKAR